MVRIFDSEGDLVAKYDKNFIYSEDGDIVAKLDASTNIDAMCAGVLLLILNKWYLPSGERNPEFQA